MYLNLLEFLETAVWFCILCGVFADGQRHIDISVNGDVVKTNITTYKIYSLRPLSERTLTISCLSLFQVPSTISLFKNDTILNVDSNFTGNTVVTKFKYDRTNVTHLHGVYTCRFQYSLNTNEGSNFEYFIEREVYINTTAESESALCASSIGFLGYFGEKVSLLCKAVSHSVEARFFQTLWLKSQSLQIKLLQNNTFQCALEKYDDYLCSRDFTVLPTLEVEISPENFILSTRVLEFSCNSSPPRLLYWEIIGDDGNILDLTTTGYPEARVINITIKQEAGRSSLRISTLVKEKIDLGIQKVVCYAYGTHVSSVAYATHQQFPESTSPPNVYPCTCPLETTTSSLDVDVENATTTKISTNENVTDQEDTDIKQEPTDVRQCFQNVTINRGEEEVNKWMIRAVCSFAIASSEALLLLIIAGIWTYHKCRTGDKNPSSKSEYTGDIVSSETELHVNPVYQSYDP